MSKTKTLSVTEIGSLFRELARLMRSGLIPSEAVTVLRVDTKGLFHDVLARMEERLQEGRGLSAVVRESGAFPHYACAMLGVGEATGRTEDALDAVARYYDTQSRLAEKVKTAVIRPMLMVGLILAVLAVIMVKVLPIFDDVYASMGGRLTGFAGAALRAGLAIREYLPAITCLLVFLLAVGLVVAAVPPIRKFVAGLWKRSHYQKGLSLRVAEARIAQSMAMCLSSGMDMAQALKFTADTVDGMGDLSDRCKIAASMVSTGWTAKDVFNEQRLLPYKQCRLLELARKTGSEAKVMDEIAEELSHDVTGSLERTIGSVEPVMVTACSLVVSAILVSVMLPLLGIMTSMG